MPPYANRRNTEQNNLYSRPNRNMNTVINNEDLHQEMHRLFNGVRSSRVRAPSIPESGDDARGRKKGTLLARYNRRHDRPDTDYNIYGDTGTSVNTNIQKDLGTHCTSKKFFLNSMILFKQCGF